MRAVVAAAVLLTSGVALADAYQSVGGAPGSSITTHYVPLAESGISQATIRGAPGIANPANRPYLPGLRPVELELLQDALGRKYHRRIGASTDKANESIIRNSLRSPAKRAHIKGILAEALYLERNPQWEYVAKANAPQVDVFRRVPGGRPIGAQIKTHLSADPSVYAREMISDHRADLFLVPDDHVRKLRALWQARIDEATARGAISEATAARRQLKRIGGLGFTTGELDDRFGRASRYAIREQNAHYVSLGVAMALMVGPSALEWWRTGSVSEWTVRDAGRAASILAVERVTTWSLARVGNGFLRATARGYAIGGLALLATDTAWTVYEYGGSRAFEDADFYNRLGGSIGSLALGTTVGSIVTAYTTVWTAPLLGGGAPFAGAALGLLSGTAAGLAGYQGGAYTSRQIMSAVDPEFLYKAELDAVASARQDTSLRLQAVQGIAGQQGG